MASRETAPSSCGPEAQNSHRFLWFNIRTSVNPDSMKDSLRKAVGFLAPEVAISDLMTANEVMEADVSFISFLQRLLLEIWPPHTWSP